MLGRCDHHPDIAITTTSNFGSLPSEKNSTFLNLFSHALPRRALSRFTDSGRINSSSKNSVLRARQEGKIVEILPFDKFLNLSYAFPHRPFTNNEGTSMERLETGIHAGRL